MCLQRARGSQLQWWLHLRFVEGMNESMDSALLLAFLRRHRIGVEASVAPSGSPQAAVVGFAVSDDLEIVFDAVGTTRKMSNLRRDPRVALVIGWDDEQTVQIEGV